MRVLLIKTSSLGDLIHSFPALTDAATAYPGIEFHWLVEESFAEVPGWHPAVSRTIPIALRRWRKHWLRAWKDRELSGFRSALQQSGYELVIDAQGLIAKSAIPAWLARGQVHGYDRSSAREPLASLFYQGRHRVSRELHAIERVRRLFAAALGYQVPENPPDYGLQVINSAERNTNQLVLLHGTTWPSKHWPVSYWAELVRLAEHEKFTCKLPWATPEEQSRAEQISALADGGQVLPKMSLTELKNLLSSAAGCVGLDSGLAHVAAAVSTPAITLYGPTNVGLTGAVGEQQKNISSDFHCAPCMQRACSYQGQSTVKPACFQSLSPDLVWQALKYQMGEAGSHG